MRNDDALAVHLLAFKTFTELGERLHDPPQPPPRPELALIRINQLIDRDPGGAWVTERDGELAGAALAIDRDGLWGLSLLIVDPEHQSAGLGRELLAALARVRRRRPPRRDHPRLAGLPVRCAPTRGPGSPPIPASWPMAGPAASSGPATCATAMRATSA